MKKEKKKDRRSLELNLRSLNEPLYLPRTCFANALAAKAHGLCTTAPSLPPHWQNNNDLRFGKLSTRISSFYVEQH